MPELDQVRYKTVELENLGLDNINTALDDALAELFDYKAFDFGQAHIKCDKNIKLALF